MIRAEIKNLSFSYEKGKPILKNVSLPIEANKVTALIGPSGCGKSTLLRCLNRIHDLYGYPAYEGEVILHPEAINILSREMDPLHVRMRIGMVFQKPNCFPISIFENVVYGLKIRGFRQRAFLLERCEDSLVKAGLWDEVKDRLHASSLALSGGQQQRLCVARALAPDPEILLLDEPTSALDPIATAKIEELILSLKDSVTLVVVTHNMQQASRVSDNTAFMYLGELVEFNSTVKVFTNPSQKKTEDYITGRFG